MNKIIGNLKIWITISGMITENQILGEILIIEKKLLIMEE